MPSETGFWNVEEAKNNHDFCYELARWVGDYIPKNTPILDAGCGNGNYLRYLHDRGFSNLLGVEGEIPNVTYFGNIKQQDLTEEFTLPYKRDVVCLEVGEHIPEQYLNQFLDNLVNNCLNKIIISWGVPGQDGYSHVSCRHNIWVINEMEKRNMKFIAEDSLKARAVVEERWSYFRNTIMIFKK